MTAEFESAPPTATSLNSPTLARPLATRGFELADWQRGAVAAWVKGDDHGPWRGTLEIFTGGGKTLIALACAEAAAREALDLRLAIVVPTEALARQWRDALLKSTTLEDAEVGLLGAGEKQTLAQHRVLIAVLNSAAAHLPAMVQSSQDPVMLIVDECHRAGAPAFSRVLHSPGQFRIGLSATPDREEFDESGEPLAYDEQVVGRSLGSVVFRFTLRDARRIGWLPNYQIHHHGISLAPEERAEYEALSSRIDDLSDKLRNLGQDPTHARHLSKREDEVGTAARSYVGATASRKDLLYRARERTRVAAFLVQRAFAEADRRILLFHERVEQAAELFNLIREGLTHVGVAIEHSRLPDSERKQALAKFRTGEVRVLVSVKSLIEGIDVPDADIGVSVASTSSVRQRIQSLGRVLRKGVDAAPKFAEMHVIYVADTVDEVIYGKEDWSDLTGEGLNHYWRWPLDSPDAERKDGPPLQPRPTEEQEWDRIEREGLGLPTPWFGVIPPLEYSVDTLGTVHNPSGEVLSNPQGVDAMVQSVRGRPGGRFWVTPLHRVVVVSAGDRSGDIFAAGVLREPFSLMSTAASEAPDIESLRPGDTYPGPLTDSNGKLFLRQKRGGVIERHGTKGSREFALMDDAQHPDQARNARAVLDAWHALDLSGLEFRINDLWDAWYLRGGLPFFLARVPGGFSWPTDEESGGGQE